MNTIRVVAPSVLLGFCMTILAAGSAGASDTDIYTSGNVGVPPNVLIILDTSGSMTVDCYAGELTYDPSVIYQRKLLGGYETNTVYYLSSTSGGSKWVKLEAGSPFKSITISGIGCAAARASLSTAGECYEYLIYKDSSNKNIYTYNCSTDPSSGRSKYYHLAVGNLLNFNNLSSHSIYKPKIDVAKQAIHDLLEKIDLDNVRVGLMRFHGYGTNWYTGASEWNRGGYLLAKCGSTKAQLQQAVDNIVVWCDLFTCGNDDYIINPYNIVGPPTSGSTPLAETMAEAGLYFAGAHSWANTSGQDEPGYPGKNNDFGSNGYYTSPIQWRCQKNYLVVITDGMPQDDYGDGNGDNIFTRSNYLNGKSIGRYYPTGNRDIDRDGDKDNAQHWSDDTAKLLYDVDLIDSSGAKDSGGGSFNDTKFEPQRVTTYTIGFGSECDKDFLRRISDSNHGHGQTFMASDGKGLEDALSGIMNNVFEYNSNFVAPVVPVSRQNNIFSGNSLYISLFSPSSGSIWKGNLKKFGYSDNGEILSEDGTVADFEGSTIPTSVWGNSANDGIIVDQGGAGAELLTQATRNFYFYNKKASSPTSILTNAANLFSVDNATLTDTTLDLLSLGSDATVDDRKDIIHFVRGDGDYQPGTGANPRGWVLGDIIHSRPAVVKDGDKNIIFVGVNDGFLHCFVDDEGTNHKTLAEDKVSEAWCFTPYELVPSLHLMADTSIHGYFVDGTPVAYNTSKELNCSKFLTFGLRRGGPGYYTLNIGDVNNGFYVTNGYLSPRYAWEIGGDKLGNNPKLGLSWGDPRVCRIKTGSSSETTAIVLPGGYDDDNQAKSSPDASDTAGMAVYAVNAADGNLINTMKFTKTTTGLAMNNCIVDLLTIDMDSDGCTDRIYAGDMGGRIFAMKQGDNNTWSARQFFQAGDGTNSTSLMKFFYAPDIAQQGFVTATPPIFLLNDYVYIGTGDREHPEDTAIQNRFYAIKNKDDGKLLKESNLTDVTDYNSFYSRVDSVQTLKGSASSGWFIRLGYEGGSLIRPGEKVVSSPIVINGIVFFTSYVPRASSSGGSDRCYDSALGEGYLYGLDYVTGGALKDLYFNITDEQENGTEALNETNRRVLLDDPGIPTSPKLTVTSEGGTVLVIGKQTVKIPNGANAKEYYWLQP
jgi:type IV pilus assembly protein PilY1